MGSIKSGDAAAARTGQYKRLGRCRYEKWSVKKAGALPQREPGSLKCRGAAATRNEQYKKWGAAATRNGQYKKRGCCRSKNR